ncbi:hypothetical protein PENVUL_c267G08487, partial [Penicillium vulpinum]
MATSPASTTLSQKFSPNNTTQQQGSKSGLSNLQVDTVHIDNEEIHSCMGKTYSKNVSGNNRCEPHEYRNEHASHTRPSLSWTDWSQQYAWELDGILQQGLSANDPQLPPSTDRSQQYSSDLLQQDPLLSSHSLLPSLGLGQAAATAISGNSPET